MCMPVYLKGPPALPLRLLWTLWNLFLSLFSWAGAIRTVPHMYDTLSAHGFKYTVCTNPFDWYSDGPVGLWTGLFIFSKIPELVDTVFLVLQKKPVIFLHWFHHTTVLVYCWHAFLSAVGPGLWFASMNYSVHSVMYLYYFLMSLRNPTVRKICKMFAPFITSIQLLQMVVGGVVTFWGAYWTINEGTNNCHVDPANYKLGMAMYVSYFCLFAVLFYNLYLGGKKKATKKETKEVKKDEEDDKICGVVDAAGMFRGTSRVSPPRARTRRVE
uniref:Elongation of fatty acids protein n=1 Tax=Eutreptiella gymnastica TaxID=73025 RepID=A0A7S1NBE6_9EUGL